ELEYDSSRIETPQPGAQQWRRLHRLGKHPLARPDKGFLAKALAPRAQPCGRERFDRRPQAGRGISVAGDEALELLAVCQIEAATAPNRALAPDRRHPLVDGPPRAGAGQPLGGHQAGRAAADDGNVKAADTGHRRSCSIGCDALQPPCRWIPITSPYSLMRP